MPSPSRKARAASGPRWAARASRFRKWGVRAGRARAARGQQAGRADEPSRGERVLSQKEKKTESVRA